VNYCVCRTRKYPISVEQNTFDCQTGAAVQTDMRLRGPSPRREN